DELSVPPYVVFPDSSLQAMALRRPQDEAHFALIPGVGSRKLEAYGATFTNEIREYCLLHGMKMDLEAVEEAGKQQGDTPVNTRPHSSMSMTRQATLNLYRAGKSIGEIALERHIRPNTVMDYLTELIEDGEAIDVTLLIPPERYDVIVAALYKAGF